MKPICKTLALVLLGIMGLADSAHAVVGCNRWGCGTNSPVIAGAQGVAGCGRWGCGLNSPVIDAAQVRAQAPFPGWGQNLNSPVVAGAQIGAHGAFPAESCAAAARPR